MPSIKMWVPKWSRTCLTTSQWWQQMTFFDIKMSWDQKKCLLLLTTASTVISKMCCTYPMLLHWSEKRKYTPNDSPLDTVFLHTDRILTDTPNETSSCRRSPDLVQSSFSQITFPRNPMQSSLPGSKEMLMGSLGSSSWILYGDFLLHSSNLTHLYHRSLY